MDGILQWRILGRRVEELGVVGCRVWGLGIYSPISRGSGFWIIRYS